MWLTVLPWVLYMSMYIGGQEHSVKEYGAVGDGVTNDTVAIKTAMQVAKDANGGRVIFDAGYTFLTAPFEISSNVILDVRGIIKGSPLNADYYAIPQEPWWLSWGPTQGHPLILANNTRNITITGGGLINGVAENWNTSQVGWTVVLSYATNIHIYGVNISNQIGYLWNIGSGICNDGYDIVCSKNVLLENSYYNGGDDAVNIKAGLGAPADFYGRPSENIVVRNMTIYMGGGIGAGDEIRAGIRNVTFEDIDMIGTVRGIFTRADAGNGGYIDGMTFRNIRMKNVNTTAIVGLDGTDTGCNNPIFKNIYLENITNDQSDVVNTHLSWLPNSDWNLYGLPTIPIINLNLKNINITNSNVGKVTYTYNCYNVSGTCSDVYPFCPCMGPPPKWSNWADSFYTFVTEYKSFSDAENYCKKYGGHLASILSVFENNYIQSLINQTINQYPSIFVGPNFWIGLYSSDNTTFQWTDNSNVSYTNWAPSAPNYSFHPCAYANSDRTDNQHYNLWDDYADCSTAFPFVCKTDLLPDTWLYNNETTAYYKIVTDTKNYSDAEKYCAQSGGHLSSILSAEENSFVTNLVSNAFTSYATTWTYWIGLYTTDNETFQWSDNSALAYTNWAQYAPYYSVHPCAYIAANSRDTQHYSHWDDYYDCSSLFPFVCKKTNA